jgi:hypothetical protein
MTEARRERSGMATFSGIRRHAQSESDKPPGWYRCARQLLGYCFMACDFFLGKSENFVTLVGKRLPRSLKNQLPGCGFFERSLSVDAETMGDPQRRRFPR